MPETWQERAACASHPSDLFVHEPDAHTLDAQCLKICTSCPVQAECLGYQLRFEQSTGQVFIGVFGGTTPATRRRFHQATGVLPARPEPGAVALPWPRNGKATVHATWHAYTVHGCRCTPCRDHAADVTAMRKGHQADYAARAAARRRAAEAAA